MHALFVATAHAADVDEDIAPMRYGEVRRLAAGASPGAFRLEYAGRVTWTQAPGRSTVELTAGMSGEPVARAEVDPVGRYQLVAEVAPGSWTVWSRADDGGPYRDEIGPRLYVDAGGGVTCVSNCEGLCHRVWLRPLALGGASGSRSRARPSRGSLSQAPPGIGCGGSK